MDQNKIIVANRFDGLGERLIAILNAIYLANNCKVTFKFIWNDMDEFDENVGKGKNIIFPSVPTKEYFFESTFIEKFFFYNYQDPHFDHELWYHKNQNIKNIIKDLFKNRQVVQCNLAVRIDTYFNDIEPFEYRKQIGNIWHNIPFSKDISEAIYYANTISKELDNYSTLHIRGGDIVYRSNILYLLTSIALPAHLAIEIIKSCDNKLVIMGNDIGLNKELKTMFNEQGKIFVAEDFFGQKKFNATQKAIFDIILMSRSKKLYFSGHSGFSVLSYLIGSCEPIYIYDKYSTKEKYQIIEKNMKHYQFDLWHQSFSYMYLYKYGQELGLPLSVQLEHLESAITLRDDAFIYKVLFIDILLQQERYQDAENWIKSNIIDKMHLFFKDLLYETHGVRGDFLYYFLFNNYFNIKNIEKYPILFNIAVFIVYKLIEIDSKIVVNNMNAFLYKNLNNFELIENCPFMENKQDIIKTLSVYFVKHFEKKIYSNQLEAVLRVQNHLSYKLGQAMILNSKSILGYIRMPFVLSYIKDKHNQEQKIYQEKIKKNSSLKLPPLECYSDYQKALEEKECLTYKLGQALIKAHKNWYKGGYIWLWFEIMKLKKIYRKEVN